MIWWHVSVAQKSAMPHPRKSDAKSPWFGSGGAGSAAPENASCSGSNPMCFQLHVWYVYPHIWVMLILNFWHAGTDVPSYIEWSRSNGTLLNEIVDGIWSFNGCHQSHNIAAQTKGKNDGFWKPPVKALCKPKGLYIWMLEIATPKQTPNMW